MLNYDFRNTLSAFEFECFSRDLINAQERLDLSNFAEGRDGGIDLRYSHGKDKSVIVQAKRYKNYNSLMTALEKEVDKVKRLKPNRYIVTTSVDLTPANKQAIVTLFSPYILSEHDIWAKQDLNKYLAQHTDIEQKYYKLWLASTNILNNILNKNIVNWTGFEKEEILNTIKTYVMNSSFDDAMKKLIENRYVVISGEPGIGKTTLARILIVNLLSDKFTNKNGFTNFEEFYYTNSNIDDFARVMQQGKRQVFFYDDFLGQITLENGEKNFDSRIISFIKACRRENDKLFILTTREYILQQGLAHYSRFNEGKGIEMSKCIVDLGKYTRFVRAQILYNHLVANEIPQEYINTILNNKNYLQLIDHPHFNPRIIETFLTNGTHEQCKPEDYFVKIKGFFDHPDSVWLNAFEQLSSIEREALLVLNTMGTIVLFEDWKKAYQFFFKRVHREANYFNETEWTNAVKVLENNFIKTNKDRSEMFVEFHNPGVKEVLTRHINRDNGIKQLLLKNAYYIEQVFGVFQSDGRHDSNPNVLDPLVDLFFEAFERIWKEYKSCRTGLYRYNKDLFLKHHYMSKAETLFILHANYPYSELIKKHPYYVEQKITPQIVDGVGVVADIDSQIALLKEIDISKTNLDMDALFDSFTSSIYFVDDCLAFADSIGYVFPNHEDFLLSKEFCKKAVECINHDFESTEDSDLEELNTKINELCNYSYLLEDEDIVSEIRDKLNDYTDYLDSKADAYQDEYREWFDNNTFSENLKIDNLFSTIKNRN